MQGRMAVNTKHTGDRRRDHRGYAEPMTREQVDSLLAEGWLRQMVQDIRGGNEKLKERLPFACPHYSEFRKNHRAQADIIPEAFTYMTCVDVDEKGLVEKAVKRTQELIADDLSEWQSLVLRMDYSARGKLHIWLRLPVGRTISEAQEEFCREIGVPYDESCITPERFIYLTGADEEIYRSEGWLQPLSESELEERREAYLMRGLDVDGQPLKGTVVTPKEDSETAAERTAQAFPTEYHGIAFKDILKKYWELNNHGYEPTEGDRDTLTFQLASDLRHICGRSFEWLDAVIPCYDGFTLKEKQQKIRNALASKFEGFPMRLRMVLDALELNSQQTPPQSTEQDKSEMPPEMPKKLPPLIRLLVSRTPEIYKPAVAHAVFPALATHLWRTRFRYIDNKLHEATLMNVLMAGTGAGKDCISEPIDHIMADIRRQDQENLLREKAWKDELNSKGANKDKRRRPEGLVIQEIDADMTNPAFVMRMAEADEHFLYVKLNEIDQFDALKGSGSMGQQFRIMCLAFDPGNRYGQTRIGTQSVTERVTIRFNWNAATTIQKGQHYFSRVLTDGPLSRINFCTIPEREIGSDIPVYGEYDATFDEELRPYIERLKAARGEIDCQQAYRLAKELYEECAEFSRLSQSRVYENFSFRANVIAYLKACVLYVANGCKWDKSFDEFIRWSLRYDLWCKMHFFGEAIEQANSRNSRTGTRGPRNLLELLPDKFTLEDAKQVRRQQGLSNEKKSCIKMIRTWINRNYVTQNTEYSFQKQKSKTT